MLAATFSNKDDLPSFPLLATPKIDGVRALIVGGILVSRTMRPIPNKIMRKTLELLLPEGADGEIFCGDLYTTSSAAMSADADIDFRFFWFDWVYDADISYERRILSIGGYIAVHCISTDIVVPLIPRALQCFDELVDYEKHILNRGYEGVMLRVPDGRYKYGRSTLREGLLIKMKRFTDSEAVIVGTDELVHKANKEVGVRGNTLGSIVAELPDGTTFSIGTGYTAEQRSSLWANRLDLVGKVVKYRHTGRNKNRPRCPVYMDIRYPDDM